MTLVRISQVDGTRYRVHTRRRRWPGTSSPAHLQHSLSGLGGAMLFSSTCELAAHISPTQCRTGHAQRMSAKMRHETFAGGRNCGAGGGVCARLRGRRLGTDLNGRLQRAGCPPSPSPLLPSMQPRQCLSCASFQRRLSSPRRCLSRGIAHANRACP